MASKFRHILLSAASRTFRSRQPYVTPRFRQSHLICRRIHAIPKPQLLSRVETQPHYRLSFTCVPCSERSSHVVSKQGYHHGSVLISCPKCQNRHVISDNLQIFGDRKVNVEDLLREKGQIVKKGTLGENGDLEFWPEGSEENDSGPN